MSSQIKDILALIEQFENTFDSYQQSFIKNTETIIQDLSTTWKNIKAEQKEMSKLEENIRQQNSELTTLRTNSDELVKKIEELKAKKVELTSKITELKNDLERLVNNMKSPKFELENLVSDLNTVNEKISNKEMEKNDLEQKRIANENREKELKSTYTEDKMNKLEKQLEETKKEYFFTSFLIENHPEELHEVDILAKLMDVGGQAKLDDIKKSLDVPPIMAVRTIRQMAVKEIVHLDEDTNTVKLP